MTTLRFIDTNILVRLIAQDHPIHSLMAEQLFQQMASGESEGLISMTVLFESAYVLESRYAMTRKEIVDAFQSVTAAPTMRMLDGEHSLLATTLNAYLTIPQLSFADCYHAALALEHCDGEIHTFDKDFRRVPGISRLEPGDSP